MSASRKISFPARFEDVLVPFIDSLPCPALLADDGNRITFVNEPMKRYLEIAQLPGSASLDQLFPECFMAPPDETQGLQFRDLDIERIHEGRTVKERIWFRKFHGCAYVIVARQHNEPEFDLGQVQTARLASLGFMVAGVCHEIANPLTAIHSTMQFLQSRQDFSAETLTRALNNINDNVKRALNIAHQLNDYTRAGSDEKTRVRPDIVIAESLKLVQQEYPCSGIIVHSRPAPETWVFGNRERLEQMFTNIMANAIQVMDGRGELSIAIAVTGSHVEITISDTGPGITPEHLACLFKPFFTTKTRGQGTGLGLAICNEIAIEHEGTIRAGNNPGGGAFFCVRLPLYTEQQ